MDESMAQQVLRGGECGRNPVTCPCGGRGYYNCDWDVWVRCPFHAGNAPHPEVEDTTFNYTEHYKANCRKAFVAFRASAMDATPMTTAQFKSACVHAMYRAIEAHNHTVSGHRAVKRYSMEAWVLAAALVAEEALREADEVRALRGGFSCGLEMHLAEEVVREREEAGVEPPYYTVEQLDRCF